MGEKTLIQRLPPIVFVNGKEYEYKGGLDQYINPKEYKLEQRKIRIKKILNNETQSNS